MTTETPPASENPARLLEESASGAANFERAARQPIDRGHRRQRRNRLLRAFLLVVFVGGVGGVGGLLVHGRQARIATSETSNELPPKTAATQQTAVSEAPPAVQAEEFESTVERDGVEVFRIRGAQTSSDDEGNVSLQQVDVDYPRGEDDYRLRADRATYNEKTMATRLEGNVFLESTNGLIVETDWLNLANGGMLLEAADDSRFAFGGVVARGNGLRVNFLEEVARLSGAVRIGGVMDGQGDRDGGSQSLSLHAKSLTYAWGERALRLAGEPGLRLGDMELSARTLTLLLDDDDLLRILKARGHVRLRAPLADGGYRAQPETAPPTDGVVPSATAALRGHVLDVEFQAGETPKRALLRGPNWGRAVLVVEAQEGDRQELRAKRIEFDLAEGVLSSIATSDEVAIHQFLGGELFREASSAEAQGRFDGRGALAEITLDGGVQLKELGDRPVEASAERAVIDLGLRRMDLTGERTRLQTAEGDLEAAEVRLDEESGCAEAAGSVRFVLDDAGGARGRVSLPFGPAESTRGPIVVKSDSARFCDEDESTFRNGVELERGADRLRAAELRLAADGSHLHASGDVQMAWEVPRAPRSWASAGEPPGSGDVPDASAWEVSSERFDYSRSDGVLHYGGGASALVDGQRISCHAMAVEVVPAVVSTRSGGPGESREYEARELRCEGDVRIEDTANAYLATAEHALYRVAERWMSLSVDVHLRRGEDEIRGGELVYWLENGRYLVGPSGRRPTGAAAP